MRALRLFGRVSFRFDQPSPLPLELAAVELSLPPETPAPAPAAPAPAPAAAAPRPVQPPAAHAAPRPAAPVPAQPPYNRPPPPPATPAPPLDPSAPIDQRLAAQWPTILKSLSRVPRRKFDIAALLRSSGHRAIRGSDLVVTFQHQSNSERLMGELEDPRCRMEVERVLQEALDQPLTIVVATGEQRSNGDRSGEAGGGHLVRAAVGYGGQVINETSHPASAPSLDPGDAPPAPGPAHDAETPAPPVPAADAVPNGATHVAGPESEPAAVPVPPDGPHEPPAYEPPEGSNE